MGLLDLDTGQAAEEVVVSLPTVSVIIPVKNQRAVIAQQLEALLRQDYRGDVEIVVADNDSSDGTSAVVRSYGKRVLLVTAPPPCSVGRARNAGAHHASGAVLLFCDGDDVVANDWISAMVGASRTHDVFGGPIESASLWPFARQCRALTLPRDLDWAPWPVGANVGVRRAAFDRLGGWREDLPAGEDVDLAWRSLLAGLDVGLVPDAVVHYRERATWRGAFQQGWQWGTAAPALYAAFRRVGFCRRRWLAVAKDVGRLAAGSGLALFSPECRVAHARLAGLLLGRAWGSTRQRCVYL